MDSSSMQLLVSHNWITLQPNLLANQNHTWNANLLQRLENRSHPGDTLIVYASLCVRVQIPSLQVQDGSSNSFRWPKQWHFWHRGGALTKWSPQQCGPTGRPNTAVSIRQYLFSTTVHSTKSSKVIETPRNMIRFNQKRACLEVQIFSCSCLYSIIMEFGIEDDINWRAKGWFNPQPRIDHIVCEHANLPLVVVSKRVHSQIVSPVDTWDVLKKSTQNRSGKTRFSENMSKPRSSTDTTDDCYPKSRRLQCPGGTHQRLLFCWPFHPQAINPGEHQQDRIWKWENKKILKCKAVCSWVWVLFMKGRIPLEACIWHNDAVSCARTSLKSRSIRAGRQDQRAGFLHALAPRMK